jgi:hypothetical protein
VALDPTDPTVLLGGTPGPADIVGMDFIMQGDPACCDASSVCMISENPRNTKLTNDEGEEVDLDMCPCLPCPRLSGDITMVTPAPGFQVNADCGIPTAEILWDMRALRTPATACCRSPAMRSMTASPRRSRLTI